MLTIPQQTAAVMRRKVQILMGNGAATAIQLFSYIFQGIIMGTVFLNMPQTTAAYFSRGGVLFLYVMVCLHVVFVLTFCFSVPFCSPPSKPWPKFPLSTLNVTSSFDTKRPLCIIPSLR